MGLPKRINILLIVHQVRPLSICSADAVIVKQILAHYIYFLNVFLQKLSIIQALSHMWYA